MSASYTVCATFKLIKGKPQLVNLTLHSIKKYIPFIDFSLSKSLNNSRYFHSQKEANLYINYLLSRYPKNGLSVPKLDATQGLLF